MNFALGEDHLFLRDVARSFVASEIDRSQLLIPGATVASARYAENWKKIVELGWPGLIVPDAYGGADLTCIDLTMVVAEMGRALVPSPFFGTLAGTWAILRAGSDEQKARFLPGIASGATATALAVADANGQVDGPQSDATARPNGERYTIDGSKSFVVDAASANTLIVGARTDAGLRFFVVDAAGAGVRIEVVPWRDVTRQVCTVSFDGVDGELLCGHDASDVWPWVRDRLLLVLSAENAAGIEHVLASTVDYAKERVAFGRPIGSYQAIKHALAETFAASECSNVATLYAAWALSENAPDASLAAAQAQAYTSDAYVAATHQSIQIFGALGFTWEMENHLYFKRARANAALFGSASVHRERIAERLERGAA